MNKKGKEKKKNRAVTLDTALYHSAVQQQQQR
jgi:hypothetical protein